MSNRTTERFTYSASSLEDIAKQFDRAANVQEALANSDTNIRRSAVVMAQARTWRDAAAMLRQTKLEPS